MKKWALLDGLGRTTGVGMTARLDNQAQSTASSSVEPVGAIDSLFVAVLRDDSNALITSGGQGSL